MYSLSTFYQGGIRIQLGRAVFGKYIEARVLLVRCSIFVIVT